MAALVIKEIRRSGAKPDKETLRAARRASGN
jgi:hypothetical protein